MSIYEDGYTVWDKWGRDGWDHDRQQVFSSRKSGKPLGLGAPHYPNKAERKLLTQMMQKSGQTEEQVRASKSNRQKLAAASKSMSRSQSVHNRRAYEAKVARRNEAARLGVQVWELK